MRVIFGKNVKYTVGIAVIFSLMFYFVFHAIAGANGLISYIAIKSDLSAKLKKLEFLRKEEELLQKRTGLLSNNSIDLDILEESAKTILNYGFPEEIVISLK